MINRKYSFEISGFVFECKKWTPREALDIAAAIDNVVTSQGQTLQSLFTDSTDSIYKGAISDQVNELHGIKTDNASKNGLSVISKLINFLRGLLKTNEDAFYEMVYLLSVNLTYENKEVTLAMIRDWPAVSIFGLIKSILAENNFLS